MQKKIAILGSTGSIGTSTLKVIRHLGEDFRAVALAAYSNIEVLEAQIKEFHPKIVAVFDEKAAQELKKRVPSQEVVSGLEGLKAVAAFSEANYVVSAMTGTLGLVPTMEAINAGKDIGLANKEVLVSSGSLFMKKVKEKGIQLLPIDSEHSALFQCLVGNSKESINRLILTASGGPFRNVPHEALENATVDQALAHPNWKMGPKVTIDSSTLMNKGLEVIEAHWLFGVPVEKIEVVIHPQSIIHSMIEYVDGAIMAQMGEPEMIVPIQYALTYPERKQGLLKPFDFIRHGKLEFSFPDFNRFRCLRLAFDALKRGGSLSCYMNAANEILVQRFISKKITWPEIGQKLETLMERHQVYSMPTLEAVLEVDQSARKDAALI